MIDNKVYRLSSPFQVSISRERLREPHQDYVRLRFLYCGLCGSDISKYSGRNNIDYPYPIGHEFVARVERLGANVSDLNIGDYVTSDIVWRCGTCLYCKTNRTHLCRKTHRRAYSNLGFSRYANFHRSYLVRLNSDTAHPRYTLAEPLSCAIHAIRETTIPHSRDILLVGCGGVGLCVAYFFDTMKLDNCIYLHDHIPSRQRKLLGCTSGKFAGIDSVNRRFDVVIDASGTVDGLNLATRAVRPGGSLTSLSHIDNQGSTDFLWRQLARKDVRFKISYLNGRQQNFLDAVGLLEDSWRRSWENVLKLHPIDNFVPSLKHRPDSQHVKEVFSLESI